MYPFEAGPTARGGARFSGSSCSLTDRLVTDLRVVWHQLALSRRTTGSPERAADQRVFLE